MLFIKLITLKTELSKYLFIQSIKIPKLSDIFIQTS